MKLSKFLASKSISICGITIVLLLWFLFAVLTEVSDIVIGVTVGAAILITAIALICKFFYVNRRLKKINDVYSQMQDGYLLGEVFPKPVNAVEEEYFQIMKCVSRSALNKVEEVGRDKQEYCDYVEKWIHEIKTPLTACSLIIANGGDMRKLKPELKKAENLTESILYCARLRTVEKDTQISKISVYNVIDSAIKSQTDLLLSANVSIEAEGDFTAYTDGKSLEFMLKQLLVNSAKYCPDCLIKITADDGKIYFEDNGAGIPAHELPRIFARGFVGRAGRAHGGGTGMGLYLVHELCEKLGIDISVQSEEGCYTKFILTFPQ